MKEAFGSTHREKGIDVIYIDEDDVLLTCENIEGEGINYTVTGIAKIEGELYHDFRVEFQLAEEPKEETIEEIMAMDWEWYDFV